MFYVLGPCNGHGSHEQALKASLFDANVPQPLPHLPSAGLGAELSPGQRPANAVGLPIVWDLTQWDCRCLLNLALEKTGAGNVQTWQIQRLRLFPVAMCRVSHPASWTLSLHMSRWQQNCWLDPVKAVAAQQIWEINNTLILWIYW